MTTFGAYRTVTSAKGRVEGMAKVSPGEFIRQVRQEVAKVTWPTRKETVVTTGMVFVMVMLMAILFYLADQVLALGVRVILRLGG